MNFRPFRVFILAVSVGFRKVNPPVYTGTGAPSAEVQFTMHGVGSDVANGMWIKIGVSLLPSDG